jgi:membrane fusion protein, multidrug efflux system
LKPNKTMKIPSPITTILFFAVVISSCKNGDELALKKEKLTSLREKAVNLQGEIATLEKEILEKDTAYFLNQRNFTLVTLGKAEKVKFVHRIDVRGSVASRNNVLVSSKVLGSITSIKAKNGSYVEKGEVIITIDASILRNSMDEIRSQLDLAITLYEKQKTLWDKNIGTEVQYLQAKNNKEGLEKRLQTLKSQLRDYVVRAPNRGQINDLFLKNGETIIMGTPLFRVVSIEAMYIKVNVSESYVGKFRIGDSVMVFLPSINVTTKSEVTSIGRVINQENRTFILEVDIPESVKLARANQVSVVTLSDYVNANALVVPTKIIQFDNLGNFVFIAQKEGESLISQKKYISTGKSYKGKTEVTSGLTGTEEIILEGYREVNKGTFLKTADLAKS